MTEGQIRQADVLVVGGGLGGLATALRLRRAGRSVVVLERNQRCGGKLAERHEHGYRWDMGPSLLTMPHVLGELFEHLGESLEEHLLLHRVEPVCRYFWPDGSRLDEDEAFFRRDEVAAFLRYAGGIHELSAEAFLTRPPSQWWQAFSPRNWRKLRHLPKLTTFATVASSVEKRIADPHLRQLFQRFATYNGSNPFLAPAAFNVIPYVEATYGGWHAVGGMARLASSLEKIARDLGVEIHTGVTVVHGDADGLRCADGTLWRAAEVVVNGDVIRAHQDWIRLDGWQAEARSLRRPTRALSGFVMLLGVEGRTPGLSHHNIFFSGDYREEFRQLFNENRPADDPTIYVSITARSDAADAPEGCDNFFVLINAPAETEKLDWSAIAHDYGDRVIAKLEKMGLEGLTQSIRCRQHFTPADFARRDLSWHGSLYGWASHSPRTAMFRPPLRSRLHPHWHFVGGTTHPGGGIPLVLLSARMVSEQVLGPAPPAGWTSHL